MNPIEAIAAAARAQGLQPWIAVKEKLAERAIEVMAGSGGAAVLQRGGALHFAYGSPRLSADIDFVGIGVARALEQQGAELARAAQTLLGCPAHWSLSRAGRLLRGKVTIEIDRARRIVLPVEAYEVPAHRAHTHGLLGTVENPEEIAADKIVASADRLAKRGTLKTTDLYDLWYLRIRLGIDLPDPQFVAEKAADYGQTPRGADLAAAVRAVPPEELRAALDGVLPSEVRANLDERAILETAALVLEQYRHVL